MSGWKILAGPQLGDPEGILGWNFEKASRWDNQKELLWETGMVKWSVKRMGGWLGCSKEDFTWSNKWIRAWQKCGMGVRWDRWPSSRSEVPKPKLSAHVHRDAHAEQGDMLLDIYHKS